MVFVKNLSKMIKEEIFIRILFFFFLSVNCYSQTPEWVTITPIDSEYYIGISSHEKGYANYQNVATKKALSIISEQIQINIKSSNELFILEN